ncbi:hypothetical protein WDU94_006343, partial [Cyamophila willieti]
DFPQQPVYSFPLNQSLVKFLAEAHRGVQGFVTDDLGNPVEKASLKIKGRDVGFQTTKYGEFWRILLPGIYKLEVYADGFAPREIDFMVVEQHPTLLNVTLHPSKVSYPLQKDKHWRPPWEIYKPNPNASASFTLLAAQHRKELTSAQSKNSKITGSDGLLTSQLTHTQSSLNGLLTDAQLSKAHAYDGLLTSQLSNTHTLPGERDDRSLRSEELI